MVVGRSRSTGDLLQIPLVPASWGRVGRVEFITTIQVVKQLLPHTEYNRTGLTPSSSPHPPPLVLIHTSWPAAQQMRVHNRWLYNNPGHKINFNCSPLVGRVALVVGELDRGKLNGSFRFVTDGQLGRLPGVSIGIWEQSEDENGDDDDGMVMISVSGSCRSSSNKSGRTRVGGQTTMG